MKMGTKNGTWVPSHQSFDDHEKTARLAAGLVAMGVPEAFASDVAFGQWKRLAFWLLANGADGQLRAMTPRAFCHVVRWDDFKKAKALWDAWMQSGFIDDPNTESARLHDFGDAFGHIIGARERAAEWRKAKQEKYANSTRTVRELSANGTRTVPEQFENNTPTRARVLTGPDRTGPDSILSTPTASPPSPPPASPPTGGAKVKPGGSGPKAPTVTLCEAWRRSGTAAGYPAVPVGGQTAKVLADAWRSSGADDGATAKVEAAVAAFFADRSDFVVRQGHSIGEFGRTSAKWLAVAAGTAPRASSRSEIVVGGATALLFGEGA